MLLAHLQPINYEKHCDDTMTTAHLDMIMGGPNLSATASLNYLVSEARWRTQETEHRQNIHVTTHLLSYEPII